MVLKIGLGFIYALLLLCKSLWIKVSAKLLNVNVLLYVTPKLLLWSLLINPENEKVISTSVCVQTVVAQRTLVPTLRPGWSRVTCCGRTDAGVTFWVWSRTITPCANRSLKPKDSLQIWTHRSTTAAGWEHTHTHTHTCWFLWFMGTLHRRNGFYTEQTVCAIALHQPYT